MEPAKPPRVVTAVPTTGAIHHKTITSIQEMIAATTSAEAVTFWWDHDHPHDRCRNALIQRFMRDPQWTHLLFLDTDVTVVPDTLDRLLAHDAPIVCAPVPTLNRRYGPPDQPAGATVGTNIMVFDDPTLRGGIVAPECPDAGYRRVDPDAFPATPFACDATGLGLCLIRRDVFERMDRPWCAFIGQFENDSVGEDVYFFRKARAAGFEVLVDPTIACDHCKHIDLTHLDLLYSEKVPISPWPRLQAPDESRRILVAIRAPRTGWLHIRLADILDEWRRQWGDRIAIEMLFSDTVRGGFVALAERVRTLDPSFTHVLLLGDDVIPLARTPGLLASVDAPIVAAMTRTLIDGKISWSFWTRDALTGRLEAPQNIQLPNLTMPFEVAATEAACMLLRRETLEHVNPVLQLLDHGPDTDRLFMQHWCHAVACATGQPPVMIPMTVERRAEVGLAGMLSLKMRLKTKLREQMAAAAESEVALAPA